jgi:hypothetical protein
MPENLPNCPLKSGIRSSRGALGSKVLPVIHNRGSNPHKLIACELKGASQENKDVSTLQSHSTPSICTRTKIHQKEKDMELLASQHKSDTPKAFVQPPEEESDDLSDCSTVHQSFSKERDSLNLHVEKRPVILDNEEFLIPLTMSREEEDAPTSFDSKVSAAVTPENPYKRAALHQTPGHLIKDIVELMSSLQLATPMIKKAELAKPENGKEDDCIEVDRNESPVKLKQIGVCINEPQGSTATVLTPMRASKKDREGTQINSSAHYYRMESHGVQHNLDLGVDQVITPVRRSTRNLAKTDYVPSFAQNMSVSMPQQDRIHTLLEEHAFAYVPNKVTFSGFFIYFSLMFCSK